MAEQQDSLNIKDKVSVAGRIGIVEGFDKAYWESKGLPVAVSFPNADAGKPFFEGGDWKIPERSLEYYSSRELMKVE